jgi:hypothetical protein
MAKRTDSRRILRSAAAVAGLIVGLGGVADATVVKQTLTATASAPRARGRAKLTIRSGSRGALAIVAQRLAPSSAYDVVVDGIKVGTLTTRARGAGKVRFSSPRRGHDALLGFEPRGASVVVRDHHGDDVLECDMPDASTDPNAVACCLPDDDGTECEDRTPEKCMEEGGTVSSATGCFPDPCATPPAGAVVCCIADSATGAFCDDDPEVECEHDLTAEACAAAHGTVVEAPSCEPNPCKPVSPVVVVCCVAEDDETECELRTPERCAKHHGTVSTATSCDPNPCGATPGGGDDQGDDNDDQGDDGGDGHHGGGDHHGGDD